MNRTRIFKPLYPGQVPGLGLLDRYGEWLDDYLKTLESDDRLLVLETERERVRTAPVDAGEFNTNILAEWERRRESAVNALAAHLAAHAKPGQEARALDFNVGSLLPRDLLVAALSRVSTGEGLSSEARKTRLQEIDAEIHQVKAEIQELTPARFTTREGDIRRAFHEHWKRIQRKVNAPCNPRGVALSASDPAEVEAWERLGIGGYVNEGSIVEPDPGPQFK